MNVSDEQRSTPVLPRVVAWGLFVVTFPLIFIGGLVTTYQAGMAVPDWPETYGYNLFLYPVSTWLAAPWDLFIEHGHRLLGALAGMVAISLVAATWRTRSSAFLRWFSVTILLGVIAQGVLGGLRVRLDSRSLAQIHGISGPLFLSSIAVFLVLSGASQNAGNKRDSSERLRGAPDSGGMERALLLFGLATAQLCLGSYLRHQPQGMSWRDFQLVTVFHVGIALLLVYFTCLTAWVWGRAKNIGHFAPRLVTGLVALIFVQTLLGCGTWLVNYGWPDLPLPGWDSAGTLFAGWKITAESMAQSLVTTAHQALGALFLALTAALLADRARALSISKVNSSTIHASLALMSTSMLGGTLTTECPQ